MKKLILSVIICISAFCLSACDDIKPVILFNHNKITKENVMKNDVVFRPNERIYYLITIPQKVETKMLRIMIFKQDSKYETYGYKVQWGKTVRLNDDAENYYDDYIVINETGAYIMKVYTQDNPNKVLSSAEFFVRNY